MHVKIVPGHLNLSRALVQYKHKHSRQHGWGPDIKVTWGGGGMGGGVEALSRPLLHAYKAKGGTPTERGEEGGFTRLYGALLDLKIGRTKDQ